MQIVVTCKKCDVERTIGSLECEGYHILKEPSRLRLHEDTATSMYLVVAEKAQNNITAAEELKALYLAGWFTHEGETYRIIDAYGGDIHWPPRLADFSN